jgi:hypothetical protein
MGKRICVRRHVGWFNPASTWRILQASGGVAVESTVCLASAIAFVLATVLSAMPVHAQTRVALVISNFGYQNARQTNDARDIAASLERFGFLMRRDAELKMVIAADQEATAPLSAAEERALKPMSARFGP